MNSNCHCPTISRRRLLHQAGAGFGTIALAGLLPCAARCSEREQGSAVGAQFPAKARRVIFLFMNGGPSHVDTFDSKPSLAKHEGQKPEGRDAKLGERARAPDC